LPGIAFRVLMWDLMAFFHDFMDWPGFLVTMILFSIPLADLNGEVGAKIITALLFMAS